MPSLLRITDAATLGIHALALLAGADAPVRVASLAGAMNASEAHLSKVMQRMARASLVTSVRGPRGGFSLARNPDSLTLLEVLEVVDGPIEDEPCLLGAPACTAPGGCALRRLNAQVQKMVIERLGDLTVGDFDLSDLLSDPRG